MSHTCPYQYLTTYSDSGDGRIRCEDHARPPLCPIAALHQHHPHHQSNWHHASMLSVTMSAMLALGHPPTDPRCVFGPSPCVCGAGCRHVNRRFVCVWLGPRAIVGIRQRGVRSSGGHIGRAGRYSVAAEASGRSRGRLAHVVRGRPDSCPGVQQARLARIVSSSAASHACHPCACKPSSTGCTGCGCCSRLQPGGKLCATTLIITGMKARDFTIPRVFDPHAGAAARHLHCKRGRART